MMRSKSLIILAIVLALLTGAYIYITKHPKKATTAESQTVEVLKLDAAKIKKITVKTKDNSLILERKDSTWVLASNPSIKIDPAAADNIATGFASLSADKVLTDSGSNLDEYGLKTPAAEITGTLDDNTEKTILIGSKTAKGDSYYASIKGDSKVYIIQSATGDLLSFTLDSIRDKNISSLDANSMNYVKMVRGDGKSIELQLVKSGSAEEQEFGQGAWVISKPYNNIHGTDSTKADSITSGIPELKISGFVEDNAKDLSKYGLDKPVLDVTAKDSKGAELHICFGKDKDDNSIYFRLANSTAIYTMDKSSFTSLDVSAFDLAEKNVYIRNINDIDSITIEGQGNKYALSMSRTTKPAEKEGDTAQTVTAYKLNDKDINETDAQNLVSGILGLTVEAENDKQVSEKAEYKFTFNLNKGPEKQVTLSYCPYNNDFYAVFRNGRADFLISKAQVQKLIQSIKP